MRPASHERWRRGCCTAAQAPRSWAESRERLVAPSTADQSRKPATGLSRASRAAAGGALIRIFNGAKALAKPALDNQLDFAGGIADLDRPDVQQIALDPRIDPAENIRPL